MPPTRISQDNVSSPDEHEIWRTRIEHALATLRRREALSDGQLEAADRGEQGNSER